MTGASVGRGGESAWAAYYEQESELDYDVAILGAGVAGLAAGGTLAAAGLRIAVIEANAGRLGIDPEELYRAILKPVRSLSRAGSNMNGARKRFRRS